MDAVVKNKRARWILLIVACCLLAGAAIWSLLLSGNELDRVADAVNGFGYSVRGEDIFVAGSHNNTCIAEVLSGQELGEAVSASRKSGFPSDVQANGEIVLMLVELANDEVITLYLRNGEIELGFVQTMNLGQVRPLAEQGS